MPVSIAAPVALDGIQALARRRMLGLQHAHAHQKCRDHGLRGARGTIDDLQRDAHALFGHDGDEHGLGPGLDRHAAVHRAHQLGAGPPLARDQFGVARHRLRQALHRTVADGPRISGSGETGHRARKTMNGRGKVRGRTAVDPITRRRFAGRLLEGRLDGALQRVVDLDILRACLHVPHHRQETGMLARTVVVDLARLLMRQDQPVALGPVVGFMRATAQVGLGHRQIGQPVADHPGMDRRPLVAGTGKRQLRLGQASRVGRPAFHKRQRLKHLAGRARIDHRLRIAPGFDNLPRLVADHGMSGVHAFHPPAAPQLDHRKRLVARHVEASFHRCANSCPQGLSRPAAFALWGDIELKSTALPEKVAVHRHRKGGSGRGQQRGGCGNEWQHG